MLNRDQRNSDGEKRRQQIEERVDVGRNEAFFGEQLDNVRQRLQEPMRADAVRAQAQLDVRQNLALDPLQIRQRRHEDKRDDRRA